jgi:hypothetical protein
MKANYILGFVKFRQFRIGALDWNGIFVGWYEDIPSSLKAIFCRQ